MPQNFITILCNSRRKSCAFLLSYVSSYLLHTHKVFGITFYVPLRIVPYSEHISQQAVCLIYSLCQYVTLNLAFILSLLATLRG
jgi:hypothetical protein